MHSIHILLFDLLNWKVYLLLLLFFVWNGEKPCTRNILDSSRNGFSFCLKAEKTFLTTFFLGGCQMWKSPDQGLNLHHSCDPSNSDNARSLTSWATRELPKVLLLFAFYFVYGVYSWAQKSTGEAMPRYRTDPTSHSPRDAAAKGLWAREASVCLCGLFGWKASCSTTKWEKCVLHIPLWYLWIVSFDGNLHSFG